jgi:hypothetical protein
MDISGLIERNSRANQLRDEELAVVHAMYGSDLGPGNNWLQYHNESHSRRVADVGKKLAQELAHKRRLDPRLVPLVTIAGAFHDHDQLLGSRANEQSSAAIAARTMSRFPDVFREHDVEHVERMILATTTTVDASGLLRQLADPDDPLQAAVADADLAGLSKPYGPKAALQLFCEMQVLSGRLENPTDMASFLRIEPDPQALQGFFAFQDRLLQRHEYLLDISREWLGPGLDWHRSVNADLMDRHAAGASFGDLYVHTVELVAAKSAELGVER